MLRSHYSKLISGLKRTALEINTRVEKNGVIKNLLGSTVVALKHHFFLSKKNEATLT